MSHLQAKLLFWSPRILCVAFAIFLSIFALDVFGEGNGFWQTIAALGMHLVPSAIVVVVLLLAWRWEWVGAVGFAVAAVLYCSWALPRHPDWAVIIATPLLVIAGLFLVGWTKRTGMRVAH